MAVHRVLQKLIEAVQASQSTDSLRSAMSEAIAAFDLNRFTYFSPTGGPRGTSIFISTYPVSWTDHYFAQRYERIDPIFTISQAIQNPFSWGKDIGTVELSRSQTQLFDEAAQFGIRNGVTLPLACDGASFAALSIAADEKPSTFKRMLEKRLAALPFFATAFHAEIRRKPWITQMIGGVPLTEREIECLHWKAMGKSNWDIARIIGVESCTVKFHITNARKKLGVRTACQAVARFSAGG